jgi:adenylate cyclase
MKATRLLRIRNNHRLRGLLLTLVALGAIGLAIGLYAADLLGSLEGTTVNTRFSIRGNQRPPSNIVLVKIDPATFRDLEFQWPFPRAVDGKVISRIAAEHPAAIAYDVQLSEPSQLGKIVRIGGQSYRQDDLDLLNDLSNYPGKVVFSNTEPYSNGDVSFLGSGQGIKLLHLVGSQPANGLFPNQTAGGVIRKMDYSISNLRTLAIVTAQVATHKRITRRQMGGSRTWIDFAGPTGTFGSVSFSQVYNNSASGKPGGTPLPPHFFRGKIVVVGATASNLQDIHATSTDSAMPGPEIQANAIATVLRGFPLSSTPGWIDVALIVLLGAAVPLASLRVGPRAAMSLAVLLGVLFTVAVQLAFNSGVVVSFVYPLAALILSGVGSLAVQLVTEAFERIRTRDLFSRFVPENVVDEVLAGADGLRLGGVQREGTVMFTDLRGFTSFAETLTPAQVIEVLNHYLSEMSDAILDHGGTLVAYMGDGIFAVFGAPLELPDHADRALATAREMLDVRLPRFNAWLREEGLNENGFRMGIGLNSGHVMSGHVGSERRVEYAAVGDTTNTASRIEGLTKGTPHQLLFSGSTKEALTSPPADLAHVGESEIRGRTATLELWTIAEPAQPGPDEAARPLQVSGQTV